VKGFAIILMLLGLLATGYLVVQDLKAKRGQGTAKMEAVEKASRTGQRVQEASRAQERRIKDIVGE